MKPKPRSTQVAFRVRPEDVERIDSVAGAIEGVAPLFTGFNTRSSVIRYLVFRGIEAVEAEYNSKKGRTK